MQRPARRGKQHPTPSEVRLLRVLWRLGQATVEQVVTAFPADQRPNYKTTHSFLRIMEGKGFVEHTLAGKAFVFRPIVSQEEIASASVNHVLTQTFDGSVLNLMMNLLEGGKVKSAELNDLERLIQQYRDSRGAAAPEHAE